MFVLDSIHDYERAEKFKLKHERAGAKVQTLYNSLRNVVDILVTY